MRAVVSTPLCSLRQLHDGNAGCRQLPAVCLRVLGDLDEMLALFDELAIDDAVDENHVSVGIVATDLTLARSEEGVVAHPVGDVMGQPGAALGTVVVGARRSDLERE